MDINSEKENLKKGLDLIEDLQLLDAIRKLIDYGKSKSGK